MNPLISSLMTQFVRLLSAETPSEQKKTALRMILMHLSARDLAVAKAVRNACVEEADLFEDEAELIRGLDLKEIIKGVK